MSIVVDLYHGTSTYFAGALLAGRAMSPLYEAQALECAAELFKAVIAITGSMFSTEGVIYPPEGGAAAWAPVVLRAATDRRHDTLIDYGDFYASLFARVAATYAANSPYGSELLHAIAVTLEALRLGGYPSGDAVAARFPAIEQIVHATHRPVVVSLASVPIERLRNETGSAFGETHLTMFYQLSEEGARVPGAIRISGSIQSFIVGGFSLSLRGEKHRPGFVQDEDVVLQPLTLDELREVCGRTPIG